jgi:hypothetical protein
MQTLKKIYRSNYAGENVISTLTLHNGEWNPVTESVPNKVTNNFLTNQAIAIGNGKSRENFELRHIANHKAGVLGVNKLQSYGCNALYRDFKPDFLVATGDDIVKEIANSGYCKDNIVYTTADSVLKYPGKFYLVPQNLQYDAGSLAAYLACFDGHKKVFLLGYDHYQEVEPVNNIYIDTPGYPKSTDTDCGTFFVMTLTQVIKTYSDVEFVRVVPTEGHWMHDDLSQFLNVRQVNFRQFTLEADLG